MTANSSESWSCKRKSPGLPGGIYEIHLGKTTMTLRRDYRQALNFYLQILVAQNKSKHTLINYQQDLLRFLHWYQIRYQLSLKKLNPKVINEYQYFLTHGGPITPLQNWQMRWQRFLQKRWKNPTPELPRILKKQTLSPNSRRRNMSSLQNFFNVLVESSYFKKQLQQNPIRPNLHRIRVKETDITSTLVLSPKDWEALNETTWKPKDRLLIHLLYFGGLRLSELAALKMGSLDIQNGVLDFARKGGKRHRLKLHNASTIITLWSAYVQQMPESCRQEGSPLLRGQKGKFLTPRALAKKIRLLLGKAGLNPRLGPHSFRKGCATTLYQQTRDLLYVRDYLNHSDAKVTQTYIDEIGITGFTAHTPSAEI